MGASDHLFALQSVGWVFFDESTLALYEAHDGIVNNLASPVTMKPPRAIAAWVWSRHCAPISATGN